MDTTPRDEELWKLAQRRAHFQRSLVSYFIINAFLWIIWWFTSAQNENYHGIPWPAWVMVSWGLGLVFQYLGAYGGGKQNLADKEYEKLKKERDNSL
ncbi:MAG: 2TM domain-containing protein [Chitinophagaceae bacterium]|nr:2TM domain-containing protein [Chitinophagaceae bacterium]